jgi:hypothetical protein
MEYCEKCDNLLDISKTTLLVKQKVFDDKTPLTVSDKETTDETEETTDETIDTDDGISKIIKKLINNSKIDIKDFQLYNFDDFIKNTLYIKLDKKRKLDVHNQLMQYYGKINDTVSAYYVCLSCSFYKEIETGKMLIHRKNTSNDLEPYVNILGIKNKCYSKILGHTRDYICINKKCESHKDPYKKDAVIYRTPKIIKVYYVCTTCESWFQVSA